MYLLVQIVVAVVVFLICLGIVLHVYERYYFPRDPQRQINHQACILAPADGRVIYIREVEDGVIPISVKDRAEIPLNEVVKGHDGLKAGVIVGIYLSPFDVHYQRSPISGKVVHVSYHSVADNYVMASMYLRNLFRIQPMYSNSPHIWENERNVIHIANESLDVYLVQIADRYVNKIECYVNEGDTVEKGEKVGMIRLGSQVDLFISKARPADVAGVQVGDQIYAGESSLSGE